MDVPPPFGYTKDGSPRTSAYYAIIGDPPDCGPGDHATAMAYLQKINAAIMQGGWKADESNRLKNLQTRWTRRAFGQDPRFNLVGTRDGRLPADLEDQLRPKQRKAQAEAKTRRKRQPQDQRSNEERRWTIVSEVDADLPAGRAKGSTVDPDMDVFEPEAGDMPMPVIPIARQYLIPGQDTKGHAHRVYCRVMPAHFRAMSALERSKAFGFRTIGDLIRWCIDHGVRELATRANAPQVKSALAQVDVIREILLDEQYYLEFPVLFEQLSATVNRHLSAGAETEARRLIAIVRHQIELMEEPHWREKYMAELMKQYGHHLAGDGAEFGGDGGE